MTHGYFTPASSAVRVVRVARSSQPFPLEALFPVAPAVCAGPDDPDEMLPSPFPGD